MNSKSVSDVLKTAFSLLLGGVIIWLLYRNTNLNELWNIIRDSNIHIILFSLIFGLTGNVIRGLRWELFLNSLGYYPKRVSLIYATLGNYAVNFLLPRAGDIWRCGIVTKYDKVPFAKTFETYIVDKVMDLAASAIMVLLSVVLYFDFFIAFFKENPNYGGTLSSLFSSAWFYSVAVGIILLIIIIFRIFQHTSPIKRIKHFLMEIVRDLKRVGAMKEKKRIFFYTILIWFLFYLYFYMCFYAFDFTSRLGPVAGLIVFAMSNLGVAVPVQGGIGAWHFMVISSLVIFGVAYEQASAFAGTVFTIQSVWIILCGVFGILALPHVKRDQKNATLLVLKKETDTKQ